MLTEQDLTTMCKKICADAGYEFTIPVKINKRLTRTLGRVKYVKTYDTIKSISMEFSYQFLATSSLDSIISIVKHECAHYLTNEITKKHHGHDMIFKQMCAKLGCKNDKTFCDNIKTTVPETEIYKYFVVCKDCGAIIGKYHRAGKVVQHPDWYYCNKCKGDLEVITNF